MKNLIFILFFLFFSSSAFSAVTRFPVGKPATNGHQTYWNMNTGTFEHDWDMDQRDRYINRNMDQVVEPYVFEDTTEIFSEEEAKRNEKGIVEIKSEQAFQKLMVRFMEKLSELDAKIETFAESELKPYLER